jgi:hypothetical protein
MSEHPHTKGPNEKVVHLDSTWRSDTESTCIRPIKHRLPNDITVPTVASSCDLGQQRRKVLLGGLRMASHDAQPNVWRDGNLTERVAPHTSHHATSADLVNNVIRLTPVVQRIAAVAIKVQGWHTV